MNQNITVIMKDENFAKALVRGMVEESRVKGLHFHSRAFDEQSLCIKDHILITDCKELAESGTENIVIEGYSVNIEDLLVRIYGLMEASGKRSIREKKGRLVGVFSDFGGSGTTSIVISLGRILAGGYGEKCLYISMTGKGEELDYVHIGRRRKPSKELVFRLRKKLPLLLPQYVFQDDYGLEFLECWPLTYYEDLSLVNLDVQILSSLGDYDWILVDYGKMVPDSLYDCTIRIVNSMDSRVQELLTETDFTLCNRDYEGKGVLENGVYSIPNDPDAFRYNKVTEVTDIHYTSEFAKTLKGVAENLMNGRR